MLARILILSLPLLLSYLYYHVYSIENLQYSIIIDAGSTGSRLFIYTLSPFSRIASAKISPGLNAFSGKREDNDYTKRNKYKNPSEQYVKLFKKVDSVIPEDLRPSTTVQILATAGMRLIPPTLANQIYDQLSTGLVESVSEGFNYSLQKIETLDGTLEGYYSILSSNYLLHIIDENLLPTSHLTPVGSLDMGGSSTQITFDPTEGEVLEAGNLFIKSYLGFGGDTLREKVWSKLVEKNEASNPCAFKGWKVVWEGKELTGTGSSELCHSLILQVLDPTSPNDKKQIDIDGIRHPTIRGKFLAMSLYFFASDCLRSLSGEDTEFVRNWPNPSPNDMREAVKIFCEQEWEDLEPVRGTIHKWTRFDGFPHRCLETVYIHTLLRDGYGFEGDSRDVEFVLEIGGEEVEWTMGMALESRLKSIN